MSHSDKVSIGFLVYNDVAFVARALDSLLAQTHEDLEIIICDDCSTDGAGEICAEYANRDPRVSYYRHPSNVGISRNMEYARSHATGEYFMWAADDDTWHPSFVASLLSALKSRPDCVVAFCPYQLVDEFDIPLPHEPIRTVDYSGEGAAVRLRKLVDAWDDAFGYGLFRRALIDDVQFPVWWWVNKDTPYNNIYPTLFHYLARGNFVLVEGGPLWFNRIKRRPNHTLPFQGEGARSVFAYWLRIVNMHAKCVEAVARGSGSAAVTAQALPIVARRLGIDFRLEAELVKRRVAYKLRRAQR